MSLFFRYYCLERPPLPGTIPRGMCNIVTFDEPQHVPGIEHHVWGYVEYERPLTSYEVYEYELAPEPVQPESQCDGDSCRIR